MRWPCSFCERNRSGVREEPGAALGVIGFDMSATRDMNVVQHEECSTPLPHGLSGMTSCAGKVVKIFEMKGLTGKIWKQRR